MVAFNEKTGAATYPWAAPSKASAGLSNSGGALGNPVLEQSGHA